MLTLAALCGCAAHVPPHASSVQVAVPLQWSGADQGSAAGHATLVQWWSNFRDPLLTTLVEQAVLNNTRVLGAQAALRQARALRDATAAALWPTLYGTASAQRNHSGEAAANNNFNVTLDAAWELDVFGARRSALHGSQAQAQASAASLGDVQVSIAAEVALAYILLRSAQARLQIASDNLADQQETLQLTLWRVQAGLLSSLEAEQARAAAGQTRAQLPSLRTSIEQSSFALAVLTGQPPASLLTLLASAASVPQVDGALALDIPAQTLRQRPDVRAAEFQVNAAQARVVQADAARRPSFRLGGKLGLSAMTLGDLASAAALARSIAASVTAPLFDAGALNAQLRAQQAALEQAEAALQAAVITALKEVEDALVALRNDRERHLHLQLAAGAAANAALLARQRYASGLVDFQTVLETQRSQRNAQDSVVSANADVSADHVRLYKALGGGWR